MKICVLALDGAVPEIIFADERLVNLRRLMDMGLYGRFVSPASIMNCTLWNQLAREEKRSILMGLPVGSPPRHTNVISVGCSPLPGPGKDEFAYPVSIQAEIQKLVGEYPLDVKDCATDRKDWLRDEILAMSGKQWQVMRHLLANHEWSYFHYADIGLDRIHHSFWNYFDKSHARYEPGNPYENVIPDYYLWLDQQIGAVMELLDGETILLVISDHAPQRSGNGGKDAQGGMFLLVAPNCPLSGEYAGAQWFDIAPTLLDLAGCDIPEAMQGRSLVAGMEKRNPDQVMGDAEQLIHDRLAGLGYI